MLVFIGWLCCGFVCIQMAAAKRRNVLFWGVLGFAFGLLTVLVLWLLPALPA